MSVYCENHPSEWVCKTCGATLPSEWEGEGVDPVIEHSELDSGHRLVYEPRELREGDVVSVEHFGNRKRGRVTKVGTRRVRVAVPKYHDDPSCCTTVETTQPISRVRYYAAR